MRIDKVEIPDPTAQGLLGLLAVLWVAALWAGDHFRVPEPVQALLSVPFLGAAYYIMAVWRP